MAPKRRDPRAQLNRHALVALIDRSGYESHAQFASKVGVSTGTLCDLESGRRQPSTPLLKKMADELRGAPESALSPCPERGGLLMVPSPMNNEQGPLYGRMGAHKVHALGLTNTTAARAAFDARFEREVDPDGVLSPAERAKRAQHARKLHFSTMAAKSAAARRRAS